MYIYYNSSVPGVGIEGIRKLIFAISNCDFGTFRFEIGKVRLKILIGRSQNSLNIFTVTTEF